MLTSIDFKISFDLTAAPKTFDLEDLTDYISQSVAEADVNGILTIVGPDGSIIYQNLNYLSPDVDVDVSRLNSGIANIPTLADGSVEPGTYTFTYSVEDSSDSTVVSLEKTFEFCYSSPTVVVDMTADCISPSLTSEDNTNYVVQGITPSITRTHTLQFPLGSNASDLISGSKLIQTQSFFTETHQSLVESDLVYDYTGGFEILDSVSGFSEIDVQCDSRLCDLYCCLHNLYKRWQEAICVNSVESERLKDRFIQAEAIRNLIKDSLECGKGDNVSSLTSKVLELGDCEPGCGCTDGEPTPVFGLGVSPSGTTVVDAGTGIVVTSNTVGDTTTYTVAIDPAILDLINAATNVAVLAGTGGITVDTNVVGGQTQYTVNNTNVTPGISSLELQIGGLSVSGLPSLLIRKEDIYGDNRFQAATFVNNNSTLTNWYSLGNSFSIDNFLDQATEFSVTANVTYVTKTDRDAGTYVAFSEELRCSIYDIDSGEIKFRLVDKNGTPLTGKYLNSSNYRTIRISVQIIE